MLSPRPDEFYFIKDLLLFPLSRIHPLQTPQRLEPLESNDPYQLLGPPVNFHSCPLPSIIEGHGEHGVHVDLTSSLYYIYCHQHRCDQVRSTIKPIDLTIFLSFFQKSFHRLSFHLVDTQTLKYITHIYTRQPKYY